MEIIYGSALFLFIGILFIWMFHERRKNAAITADEISKTHYYDLLERINRLHPDKHKNAEQLTDLQQEIRDYNTTYSNLPETATREFRLRNDLKLKEKELLDKLHLSAIVELEADMQLVN